MKKIYYLFIAAFALSSLDVQAQCGALYRDEVFSSFTKTTVTYSTPYNQVMDIYTPDGDNSSSRPLMLLCHGGSFYGGDRLEPNIVDMCERYAKRGYVTASIEYRLTSPFNLLDSTKMLDAVMKAISDAKAAVRYFTQDANSFNPVYRVDPNRIIIGGNSAGAILAIHYAYIDDVNEVPAHVQAAIAANGGLDGDSGNPGFPSDVIGVYNLCGGINDLSWISPDDEPIISFHGTDDLTVQYNCGDVYEQAPYSSFDLIDLCGSNAMKPVLDQAGVLNEFYPYPGQGHSPWSTSVSLFEEVDSFGRNFFYELLCNTSISEPNSVSQLTFFPNPSSGQIQIRNEQQLFEKLQVLDLQGRRVFETALSFGMNTISVSSLSPGMYVLQTLNEQAKVVSLAKMHKQ